MDIPLSDSLAPRFIIFHYILKWFIKSFGIISYYIWIVGGIAIFCIYALTKSCKTKEWDRVIMIVIFMGIAIGGLIGFGMEFKNSYAMIY